MTLKIKKRLQLWSQSVPGGWRVVNIRQGTTINPFYFSPEGKRFSSLQAVKVHAVHTKKQEKKHRRKRKRKIDESFSEPTAKKLKFDDCDDDEVKKDTETDPLSLPAEILKKRKMMSVRSPFRNLLKRTLLRNHNRFRGRLTLPQESSKRRASDEEEDTQAPESKRQKIVNSPTKVLKSTPNDEDTDKSDDEPKNNGDEDKLLLGEGQKILFPSLVGDNENNERLTKTPPRISQPRRNLLFTPPNLTPPVTMRRNSNITFSSPNQRPLVFRNTKPLKPATYMSKTSFREI